MQITSCFEAQQEAKQLQYRIVLFVETFPDGTQLNASGIRKLRGASPVAIFQSILMRPFHGDNFFGGIVLKNDVGFEKDAAYGLLETNTEV